MPKSTVSAVLFICYCYGMPDIKKVIGDYQTFLDDILTRVVGEGFDLGDFVQIDHMCYRTISAENYAQKKTELEGVARLLGENMINGRPISTFRLREPLIHKPWRIDAIELPAPKTGAEYTEGLEHIEFVLYDDLSDFLKKYDGKPFEMRAADRGINPEIGFQLGEYSVKFHLLNLPTVVYLEKKLGMDDIRDGQ
jgi:predicted metalloenzyme YecM